MGPETHRLDREAMLAEHQAVARRIRHEVDDAVAVAAEMRRASFEQFVDHVRAQAAAWRVVEHLRTRTNHPAVRSAGIEQARSDAGEGGGDEPAGG